MTSTSSTTLPGSSRIFEVMKTNHILGMQALVICPDEGISRMLTRALIDMGIAFRLLDGAEAALQVLKGNRFDLVVVDCDDAVGGLTALQLVRRTPSNKMSTVLAVVDRQTPMQEAFRCGATLAMQKPFSATLLGLILRASLGNLLRERRRHFRHPVEIPVTLSMDGGPDVRATAINLSEDGMALQTRISLPSGQPVLARFELPGSRKPVEAAGAIAWTDRSGRLGLRFLRMQVSARRALEQWLQAQFEQLLAEQRKEAEGLLPCAAPPTV